MSFFITKHVDSDAVLFFDFVVVFLSYREIDSIIVQLINHLLVLFLNSLRVFNLWV